MTGIITTKTPNPSLPLFTAIIVAAGNGTRFGHDLPKQYVKIHGKTILRHTLECFLTHPNLKDIVVVIGEGFEQDYNAATTGLGKLRPYVLGGTTRQQSVYNALKTLDLKQDDIVLIHDAARPCLPQFCIDHVLTELTTNAAATLAIPIMDTLRKGGDDILGDAIDRDHTYAIQTPQGFHFGLITDAHKKFENENMSDDTALATAMGVEVHIAQGHPQNIKITRPEDIIMAQHYLSNPQFPRTGLGFDVHAFGDESDKIRIGGVDIPHTHKLKGHSDADVLLHAITDALYGVIADGDIGSHFPPNNPDYKGKDSAFFLEKAMAAVTEKGGKIINIDSVIMCEAPKIGPHRETIQQRVADILGISPTRVSIKATTTEELGFTGRREGIAAQAIATVLLPDQDES
jgi:2-C-methyl-D-erythritol 4-phosphate cytidylyltransferase/2-C-methyl-D-erythritol 2,4-cyclodiphosphate synthase